MRRIFICLVVACGSILIGTGAVPAASVEYCDLYASAYVGHIALSAGKTGAAVPGSAELQRAYDTSWAKCLNQDEEPKLPPVPAAAAAGEAPEAGDVTGSVAEPRPRPDVASVEEGSADDGGAPGPRRGSGLKPWTPEWVAWCKAHYRSFDPETGTVLPLAGERTLCK